MRPKYLVAAMALGAIALAACGTSSTPSGAAQHQPAAPVAITTTGATVNMRGTSLGTVLTSSSGHTLYALTKDTQTTSTCVGDCAKTWPPLVAGTGWSAARSLDRSLFAALTRKDGTRQVVAGTWPLYTFSGDSKPGDVNGEGSGGVWFAVDPAGKLIKTTPSSPTAAPMGSGYGY